MRMENPEPKINYSGEKQTGEGLNDSKDILGKEEMMILKQKEMKGEDNMNLD